MEKAGISRSVLKSEYQALCKLDECEGIIQVHDFVDQEELDKPNFIVLDLKGKNLAQYRINHPRYFQGANAIHLLL